MPKFPKAFGRRKSGTNVLEDLASAAPSPSGESSFRVLERPQHKPNVSFDGGIKLTKAPVERPNTSPMQSGGDNMFAGMNRDRYVNTSIIIYTEKNPKEKDSGVQTRQGFFFGQYYMIFFVLLRPAQYEDTFQLGN